MAVSHKCRSLILETSAFIPGDPRYRIAIALSASHSNEFTCSVNDGFVRRKSRINPALDVRNEESASKAFPAILIESLRLRSRVDRFVIGNLYHPLDSICDAAMSLVYLIHLKVTQERGEHGLFSD